MLIMDCNRCISRLSISLSPFQLKFPSTPSCTQHMARECQRATLCWKLACSSFSNTLIKEALSISQPVCPGYAAGPAARRCASHGFCYRQIIAQMHAAHVETQLQLKVKEKRVNWLGSLATLNALIEIANCSSSRSGCRNWHYQKAIRKNVQLFFAVFSWLYKLNCSFNLEWK